MRIEQIGESIARLRREKGVTQEALAAELGVTAQAVSKWETGRSLPDALMLADLADFFGVATDEIMGRRGYVWRALTVLEDESLRPRVEILARRYGCQVVGSCASFAEAMERASAGDITLILIGAREEDLATQAADLEKEEGLAGVRVFQSVSADPDSILNGLEWSLRSLH